MATLTVTSRGQVTFRKEVLQHLGVKPGEKIELELLPGRKVALQAARKKGKLSELAGVLKGKTNGARLTIEEMDEAIGEAIVEENLKAGRSGDEDRRRYKCPAPFRCWLTDPSRQVQGNSSKRLWRRLQRRCTCYKPRFMRNGLLVLRVASYGVSRETTWWQQSPWCARRRMLCWTCSQSMQALQRCRSGAELFRWCDCL